MIVLLDNYDSFTYNLYQLLRQLGKNVEVIRNDRITPEQLLEMKPESLVISPGPGTPRDAGICLPLIRRSFREIPILGICLGHQAIGEAFGARVTGAKVICHGKQDTIRHGGRGLFSGLPGTLEVGRYHSLVVEDLPDCLETEATAPDGSIMAIRHRQYPVYGLQFHPESILTNHGREILERFVREGEYHA